MPFKDKQKAKEYAKAYREKRRVNNAEYQKQYQAINKDKLTIYKAAWYKNKRYDKYGISKPEFDNCLSKQKYACAICQNKFDDTNRVHIDHCHTTGKVRGLLCFFCNTGLGQFRDDSTLLENAKRYLHDHPFCYS